MIAILSGTILEKNAEIVVIDCSGVGYGCSVTNEDFGGLAVGSVAKLYIYEHIREQSHDLYGFRSMNSKKMFEMLLGVNGVGPKAALAILGIANLSEVQGAIISGDVKFIQTAPGVGKKVAERVVLDLQSKLGGESSSSSLVMPSVAFDIADEAHSALVALGYSPSDAARALVGVDPNLPTQQRIKLALQRP